MFKSIKRLFVKPKKSIKLQDLNIGQFIELDYKHPSELGIINNNTLTYTRLNEDELINRVIQGNVCNLYRDDNLWKWFITVKTYKQTNYGPRERTFLFIEDEINNIRLLK